MGAFIVKRNFGNMDCNNPSIYHQSSAQIQTFENSNKTRKVEQSGHVVIVLEALKTPTLCVFDKMAED
jgi:hypothetical protein